MDTKKQSKDLAKAVIKQMIGLSTAGFGLVAALAWNNVIQEAVATYVKPYLPNGSGIVSLLIYAVIITLLAVVVTYNLTAISEKLEKQS